MRTLHTIGRAHRGRPEPERADQSDLRFSIRKISFGKGKTIYSFRQLLTMSEKKGSIMLIAATTATSAQQQGGSARGMRQRRASAQAKRQRSRPLPAVPAPWQGQAADALFPAGRDAHRSSGRR